MKIRVRDSSGNTKEGLIVKNSFSYGRDNFICFLDGIFLISLDTFTELLNCLKKTYGYNVSILDGINLRVGESVDPLGSEPREIDSSTLSPKAKECEHEAWFPIRDEHIRAIIMICGSCGIKTAPLSDDTIDALRPSISPPYVAYPSPWTTKPIVPTPYGSYGTGTTWVPASGTWTSISGGSTYTLSGTVSGDGLYKFSDDEKETWGGTINLS